jgi:hypothetical protein
MKLVSLQAVDNETVHNAQFIVDADDLTTAIEVVKRDYFVDVLRNVQLEAVDLGDNRAVQINGSYKFLRKKG